MEIQKTVQSFFFLHPSLGTVFQKQERTYLHVIQVLYFKDLRAAIQYSPQKRLHEQEIINVVLARRISQQREKHHAKMSRKA